MAHIHTNPGEHDHTVSAYILKIDSNGTNPKTILHRHKKLGMYLQFGGHIELTENPLQALTHELKEESGYDISQFRILQPKNTFLSLSEVIVHPIPFSYNTHAYNSKREHFHTDTAYLLVTSAEPKHKIDKGESKDIRTFSEEQLEDLQNTDIYQTTKQLCKLAFQIYDNKDSGWEMVDTDLFKL